MHFATYQIYRPVRLTIDIPAQFIEPFKKTYLASSLIYYFIIIISRRQHLIFTANIQHHVFTFFFSEVRFFIPILIHLNNRVVHLYFITIPISSGNGQRPCDATFEKIAIGIYSYLLCNVDNARSVNYNIGVMCIKPLFLRKDCCRKNDCKQQDDE